MRYLIVIITTLYFTQAKAQTVRPYDSLKKYSYIVASTSFKPVKKGDKANTENVTYMDQGTCFFVKKHDSLFLVSAYHFLSGYDDITNTGDIKKIDFFKVRFMDKYGTPLVRLIPSKKLGKMYFLEKPDIAYIYCGDIFKGHHINTIPESLMINLSETGNQSQITYFSYGFPITAYDNTKINKEVYFNYTKPEYYEAQKAELLHYPREYVKGKIDLMYWMVTPHWERGASGSPVFRIKKTINKEWVEFAGIISSGKDNYNYTSIVKDQVVLDCLRIKRPNPRIYKK